MRHLILLIVFAAALGYASDGLGVGVIVGEPTGLSAKYWMGDRVALDAAAAWSFWGTGAAINVHGDILRHHFEWLPVPAGRLPVYYGIGARVRLATNTDVFRVSARVPLGVEYLFDEIPVGLFLETALLVDVLPSVNLWANGAVGARYYFR